MKRIFPIALVLVALLSTGMPSAQAQETLTNQSIVQMVNLHFDKAIIESRINTSPNDFDVSTSALMVLQKDSVPSSVIAAMMTAASDPTKKVVDMNDFHSPHPAGIYYYDDKGDLVELLSTLTSGTKVRNALGRAFSYGIAKSKLVAQVAGTAARISFREVPKFYFYFDQQGNSSQQFNQYAFTAKSPNEFILTKMDIKKSTRELLINSGNDYTSEQGTDSELSAHFGITQISPSIFEVTPDALAPGQYCFLYGGAYSPGNTRVYDFGIQ